MVWERHEGSHMLAYILQVTNLTFCYKAHSITLTGKEQYQETPFRYNSVHIRLKLIIWAEKMHFSYELKGLRKIIKTLIFNL